MRDFLLHFTWFWNRTFRTGPFASIRSCSSDIDWVGFLLVFENQNAALISIAKNRHVVRLPLHYNYSIDYIETNSNLQSPSFFPVFSNFSLEGPPFFFIVFFLSCRHRIQTITETNPDAAAINRIHFIVKKKWRRSIQFSIMYCVQTSNIPFPSFSFFVPKVYFCVHTSKIVLSCSLVLSRLVCLLSPLFLLIYFLDLTTIFGRGKYGNFCHDFQSE